MWRKSHPPLSPFTWAENLGRFFQGVELEPILAAIRRAADTRVLLVGLVAILWVTMGLASPMELARYAWRPEQFVDLQALPQVTSMMIQQLVAGACPILRFLQNGTMMEYPACPAPELGTLFTTALGLEKACSQAQNNPWLSTVWCKYSDSAQINPTVHVLAETAGLALIALFIADWWRLRKEIQTTQTTREERDAAYMHLRAIVQSPGWAGSTQEHKTAVKFFLDSARRPKGRWTKVDIQHINDIAVV